MISQKVTPLMLPVVSSNVAAVGYLFGERALFVRFVSGPTYRYEEVPEDVYSSLLTAESVGKTFNRLVKRVGYSYRRLDDGEV